jgi:glutathione S-transferase
MKLFYAPGACSIGIHVLLEEIGKPYELQQLALRDGEQMKPDYVAVNPKSKVPALVRDDGSVVTEFPAIAYYLGRSNPAAKLFPEDLEAQVRVLETMEYIAATVHMQGFTRIFRPTNFTDDPAKEESVKAAGLVIAERGLAVLDQQLGAKTYVAGAFSIADAAQFFVEFWYATRMGKTLPANLARHYAAMNARPSVQKVLKDEGFVG